MNIPTKFKMAGGQEFHIENVDKMDDGQTYGIFNPVSYSIVLANNVKDTYNDEYVELSESEKERTFWHEFVHCMQWYCAGEYDETQAQTYSNFLYEFFHTKQ